MTLQTMRIKAKLKAAMPWLPAVVIMAVGASVLYIYGSSRFDDPHACPDILPSDNVTAVERQYYDELRTSCIHRDLTALNSALRIRRDEIEVACQPNDASLPGNQPPRIYVSVLNKSQRDLLFLNLAPEPMAATSSLDNVSHGEVRRDYYLVSSRLPASGLSVLAPAQTLTIGLAQIGGIGKHEVDIAIAAPQWFSMRQNTSRVRQSFVAFTTCRFELHPIAP